MSVIIRPEDCQSGAVQGERCLELKDQAELGALCKTCKGTNICHESICYQPCPAGRSGCLTVNVTGGTAEIVVPPSCSFNVGCMDKTKFCFNSACKPKFPGEECSDEFEGSVDACAANDFLRRCVAGKCLLMCKTNKDCSDGNICVMNIKYSYDTGTCQMPPPNNGPDPMLIAFSAAGAVVLFALIICIVFKMHRKKRKPVESEDGDASATISTTAAPQAVAASGPLAAPSMPLPPPMPQISKVAGMRPPPQGFAHPQPLLPRNPAIPGAPNNFRPPQQVKSPMEDDLPAYSPVEMKPK